MTIPISLRLCTLWAIRMRTANFPTITKNSLGQRNPRAIIIYSIYVRSSHASARVCAAFYFVRKIRCALRRFGRGEFVSADGDRRDERAFGRLENAAAKSVHVLFVEVHAVALNVLNRWCERQFYVPFDHLFQLFGDVVLHYLPKQIERLCRSMGSVRSESEING